MVLDGRSPGEAAQGPQAPAPTSAPVAAAAANAVARWIDGDVVVQILEGAPRCDVEVGDEPRRLTLRPTDDFSMWNLTSVEVHTADGLSGAWYPDGDYPVTGLGGSSSGEVALAFAPVSFERDDGGTERFPGAVRAKWCGTPLGDSLATPTEDGDIRIDLFPAGELHACGRFGDRSALLRGFVSPAGTGWGFESVSDAADTDDFFLEGSGKRPVKGIGGTGGVWELSFAPVAPAPRGGRNTTLVGPLRSVWCGEAPPAPIGADAPGATGAWMGVAGRWFEVKGARSSVSGRLLGVPSSWNVGYGTTPAAPTVTTDRVDFTGTTGVVVGDLKYEVRGQVDVVRCD